MNESYIRQLAVSTVRLGGSVILPVNLTQEDWATTMSRVLEEYEQSNFTQCLDQTTIQPSNPKRLMCSLKYLCDFDPGRFPQYILHADCGSEEVHYTTVGKGTAVQGMCHCKPVLRPLTVLRFVGCDPYEQWRMEQQVVSVGCSCVNIR